MQWQAVSQQIWHRPALTQLPLCLHLPLPGWLRAARFCCNYLPTLLQAADTSQSRRGR